MLSAAAPAKVNLSLRITGRRADGYHLLQSLVVFAEVADRLTATPAPTLALTIGGPFARGLSAEDNLVIRAWRAVCREAGVPEGARLHLEKRLPVGAGIGGGSSDAAAAIRLACTLHGIALSPERQRAVALLLGADVPVCLTPVPQWMEGVGETLRPLPPLPPLWLVLVNPGVALATVDVFRRYRPPFSTPLPWERVAAAAAAGWQALLPLLGNDLLAAATSLLPEIPGVIEAIGAEAGCIHAGMSGSGSTCFGLFGNGKEAAGAARRLAQRWPDYWVVSASAAAGA